MTKTLIGVLLVVAYILGIVTALGFQLVISGLVYVVILIIAIAAFGYGLKRLTSK